MAMCEDSFIECCLWGQDAFATFSLGDKSPMHSPTPGLVRICRLCQLAAGAQRVCQTGKANNLGRKRSFCAHKSICLYNS
jgi:hypothetical protein